MGVTKVKKAIKRIVITVGTFLVLIGGGGTALAAAGYITWDGSADFQQAMENLSLISDRGQELKTERDGFYRENEQLINQVKDRDNLINAKQQEIDALSKENKQLKESSTNKSNELKQAEHDMKDVNQKSKEVLNSLK